MSLVKCRIPQYWTLLRFSWRSCWAILSGQCLDWRIPGSPSHLMCYHSMIPSYEENLCFGPVLLPNEKPRLPEHCNKTKSNLISHLLNTDASNEGYSVLIQIIFLIPIRLFIKRKLMERNCHFSGKEPDCQHTPR